MSTNPLEIRSRAPTRIDLAGGTIDLWPLYLFIDQPLTINLAIDLYADAALMQTQGKGRVTLRSEDQSIEGTWAWKDLLGAPASVGASPLRPSLGNSRTVLAIHPALELHFKLLRHYALQLPPAQLEGMDLRIGTRARSPAGAGLGGSSALGVALVGVLGSWARAGAPLDPAVEGERMVEVVRDIETTVIQVPAGVQDYYGAMFGGLQALRWRPSVHQRASFPLEILRELEGRITLFYSGQSRNSGINNWAVYKSFIDRDTDIRSRFVEINLATHRLEAALTARDWAGVGQAIADEWTARRKLAPGITTGEINKAYEEASKIARVSGKVCGAGGGGCFFVYSPDGNDPRITEAVAATGVQPLPFKAVPAGLEVKVARV
jgi:D-glycero-alpha-D-manno-heptose-7-phosphate kinase